jgi:hypothetical protein
MLAQRCEQQRPVILNPEVTLVLHKIAQAFVAIFQLIRRLEVLLMEPLLVSAPDRRMVDGSLAVYSKKEVNGSLLVRIFV